MLSWESVNQPLARLVLFMVCLSIAGSIIAAVWYVAPDPGQQPIQPPENRKPDLYACQNACKETYVDCCGNWCYDMMRDPICGPARDACLAKC
jgi:hypothetical protein